MSDLTECEFCRSRLKTVGCPACLGLMFLGSKFCTNCGALAAAVTVLDNENSGDCPRCKTALQTLQIGTVGIRECNKCGGFWSDAPTFESICVSQEQQSAVLGFIQSDAHPHAHPATISYVPCPDCKQLMNRSNFARSSGVIVDICKQHGVWFDADELPKIITFINSGGMSRSREKEKMSIEDERRKLRDEQRRMATMQSRSGLTKFDEDDRRSGVGRVIRFLFDI